MYMCIGPKLPLQWIVTRTSDTLPFTRIDAMLIVHRSEACISEIVHHAAYLTWTSRCRLKRVTLKGMHEVVLLPYLFTDCDVCAILLAAVAQTSG